MIAERRLASIPVLASADPPVVLAAVNLDNPRNHALIVPQQQRSERPWPVLAIRSSPPTCCRPTPDVRLPQERFGVLSFPVGKIFHRGRLVGDFMGGSLAHEIIAEMLTVRDDLLRAEAATQNDGAPGASTTASSAAAPSTDSKDEL